MLWGKIFLLLLGLLFLALLIRFLHAAWRFKRSFDDFSVEAGERLLRHAEQVDSTLERWHEYDEVYQEGLEHSQGGSGDSPSRRGVTLDPTGGSPRKRN